jgi:uncharacterized protein YbdZ (MbtH family)
MSMSAFDEDAEGGFLVLVDDLGRHSLWPAFVPEPGGWRVAFGAAPVRACHEYVESAWRSLRPGGERTTPAAVAGREVPT